MSLSEDKSDRIVLNDCGIDGSQSAVTEENNGATMHEVESGKYGFIKKYFKKFYCTLMGFIEKNYKIIIACAIAAVVAAIFSGILADKSLSPAEGWYSYYAYLINEKNAVPYVDFELLFPPLYVYCIAFYTAIFGYKIIALRILGVLIYSATCVFAVLIFYKLFKNEIIACVTGILVTAFLQSEIVQISYDYIRFMDLSVYISIFFMLCYLQKYLDKRYNESEIEDKNKKNFSAYADGYLITSAVFATFASMYKQSSGLVFVFGCVAMLCLLFIISEDKKEAGFKLLWFVIIVATLYLLMWIILLCLGGGEALSKYFYYNFFAASGSKGGVYQILFGNLFDSLEDLVSNLSFALFIFFVVLLELFFSKIFPNRYENKWLTIVGFVVLAIVLVAATVLLFLNESFSTNAADSYSSDAMYWSFLATVMLFVLTVVLLFTGEAELIGGKEFAYKYLFINGIAILLAYAVVMSGGFSQSQVALCLGVSVASIAYFAKQIGKQAVVFLLTAVMCLQSLCCFAYKITTVYSWWELTVGTYWEQSYSLDGIDYLDGIKVSEAYYTMYNNVNNAVNEYTTEDDYIFVFPHAPILYLVTHRDSNTYTKVQWFDVSTDTNVVADVEKLKESPPKVLIYIKVPDSVVESHEETFRDGGVSGLHVMRDVLDNVVASDEYWLYSSDDIGGGYIAKVYIRNDA